MTNMSTRNGKVEFLSDLIQEAKQVAFESMDFSKSILFGYEFFVLKQNLYYFFLQKTNEALKIPIM
jgi:hypothetical protein